MNIKEISTDDLIKELKAREEKEKQDGMPKPITFDDKYSVNFENNIYQQVREFAEKEINQLYNGNNGFMMK